MSYVLAFDTSTEAIALALGSRTGSVVTLLGADDEVVPRQANSRLLPSVRRLLAQHGLGVDELETVVVGLGPGSFTGVRIAVATAKGLASGLGTPLHSVGTLDACAWTAIFGGALGDGLLAIVGDAMRGEVYPALFEIEGGVPRRLGADRVAPPEQVAEEWAQLGRPMMLSGNGLRKHASVLLDALGDRATTLAEESWLPTGAGVLAAFEDALGRGEAGSGEPGALLPVYTRLSDAEEAERARAGAFSAPTPDTGVAGPEAAS